MPEGNGPVTVLRLSGLNLKGCVSAFAAPPSDSQRGVAGRAEACGHLGFVQRELPREPAV